MFNLLKRKKTNGKPITREGLPREFNDIIRALEAKHYDARMDGKFTPNQFAIVKENNIYKIVSAEGKMVVHGLSGSFSGSSTIKLNGKVLRDGTLIESTKDKGDWKTESSYSKIENPDDFGFTDYITRLAEDNSVKESPEEHRLYKGILDADLEKARMIIEKVTYPRASKGDETHILEAKLRFKEPHTQEVRHGYGAAGSQATPLVREYGGVIVNIVLSEDRPVEREFPARQFVRDIRFLNRIK